MHLHIRRVANSCSIIFDFFSGTSYITDILLMNNIKGVYLMKKSYAYKAVAGAFLFGVTTFLNAAPAKPQPMHVDMLSKPELKDQAFGPPLSRC